MERERERQTDRQEERETRVEYVFQCGDSTPRVVRSVDKSSTSPADAAAFRRASSPHAWQRKIALNTAQMETKSRPKDAHRGIETRSLFSKRPSVDCGLGWPRRDVAELRQPYRDVLWPPILLSYRAIARGSPIQTFTLLLQCSSGCLTVPVCPFFLSFSACLCVLVCMRCVLRLNIILRDIDIKVPTLGRVAPVKMHFPTGAPKHPSTTYAYRLLISTVPGMANVYTVTRFTAVCKHNAHVYNLYIDLYSSTNGSLRNADIYNT